jgi:hypothetical protein
LCSYRPTTGALVYIEFWRKDLIRRRPNFIAP